MRHDRRAKSTCSPFEAARRILCGPTKHEPRPVEKRIADVSLLDELASLDITTAKGAFERMERARVEGAEVDPADVQLFASSTESVRRSVVEKAKTLGTYGGESPEHGSKNESPTVRVYVTAGELPPETDAPDAKHDQDERVDLPAGSATSESPAD